MAAKGMQKKTKKKQSKTAAKRPATAAKKSVKKPTKSAVKAKVAPKKAAAKTGASKKKPTRVIRKTKRPTLRPKAKAKASKKSQIKVVLPVNDEALKLARLVALTASDKKALDVMILDVRRKGAAVGYDYVVLATAESDRQLEALADATKDAAKATGRNATGIEASPDWVLVNFDDVVVHYFTPDKRETYDIEGLWSDAPRIGVEG